MRSPCERSALEVDRATPAAEGDQTWCEVSLDYSLPASWNSARLDDLAIKVQDGTHFSPKSETGPFRYLTSKNIRFRYLDLRDCGWISQEEHSEIFRRCDVAKGDILLTKDGANTGNTALNSLDEPFSLLSSVAMIRCNPTRLHAGYLLQYLLSPATQRRLKDEMSGNAISRITLQKIKNLRIIGPQDANEQWRIAAVLDTVDEAIAKTEAVIAKLKQVRAGLLHDLLTRGLDEHSHLRDPIAHPEEFQDSPLGRIPREWTVRSLDGTVRQPSDLTIGPFGSNLLASDYRLEGAPVVFVRDVREDGFVWNSNIYVSKDKADELRAHFTFAGDVLITKMGLPPCIAAVYPDTMPSGVVTADVIRLRPRVDVATSFWLAAYINSPRFAACVRQITGGAEVSPRIDAHCVCSKHKAGIR